MTTTKKPDAKQLTLQKELASRILSRRRLLPFILRVNPKYLAGWVHEDICRRLERFSEDVAAGKSPRLMLLMPPRHGKSEIASKNFPAWHLGRYPDHEFIACSYNLSLAMGFSRKVKQILDDPLYQSVFEGTRLDPNNQSTEEWGVHNHRGGYVAAGIGGPITGKGAHVLVIDDPVKNAEEADSADGREKTWEWYLSTAYSRLAPGGGVLVIQCMTGDTPVLTADGAERRLDTLVVGDQIATFDRGTLGASEVRGIRSNGHDSVLKITMSSGRVVRANGRHPFLVDIDGELKWMRARSLATGRKIVALPGSGGSGRTSGAQPQTAGHPPSAADSALRTTTSRSGLPGTAPQAPTRSLGERRTSSTGMESPRGSTTPCLSPREGSAPSVQNRQEMSSQNTGGANSPLTTATALGKSVVCCATTATQESDILELSPWHLPQPGTSDFTTDEVVSVEHAGTEEVFDLQVERTENFIANGLVSHNTWWHDDDLAGRLQQMMAEGGEDDNIDQFEVVKYPALAETDEWLEPVSDTIIRVEHLGPQEAPEKAPERLVRAGYDPAALQLLRLKGEALHPARYDVPKLLRIKAQNKGGRWWSALYQQNPVPDDGAYFTKDQFKRGAVPSVLRANVYIAFDFAISEKKQNDFTVGTVGLQDDNDVLHVADVLRFKSGDAFFIVEAILNLATRWYSPTLILGFEDGQIWRSIEALLRKRMRERKFYPSIEVLKPITDKMARARVIQGRMQQGMVSFNSEGDWYDTVRTELLRFPAGVHDDCVDSLAWMAQLVVGREAPRKLQTKRIESWKDRLNTGPRGHGHMVA